MCGLGWCQIEMVDMPSSPDKIAILIDDPASSPPPTPMDPNAPYFARGPPWAPGEFSARGVSDIQWHVRQFSDSFYPLSFVAFPCFD
jgi:hypothetical protein